jgi:Protein kinase domain
MIRWNPNRMTRDPRTDPQPGDELRDGANVRCVLQREGDTLWCLVGLVRFKTSLERWQEWCQQSGAEVVTVENGLGQGLDTEGPGEITESFQLPEHKLGPTALRPALAVLPEVHRGMVFDPELWKQWEGQSVDGVFPLERCVGGTNHGAVFQTQFQGQPTAIKLVPGSPEFITARLASWESAATLSHPNLIPISASGETVLGGLHCAYIVMERADENLAEVLAKRPLTSVETREMLVPVLSALRYLHSNGFVHGNLKAPNILAFGEQLKISADSVGAGTDAAGDCQAIGVLLEQALGNADQSSMLPEPFADIAKNCRNPDATLRWDIPRIEACFHTNPPHTTSGKSRNGWWGFLTAGAVILGLVAFWPARDGRPRESAVKQAPLEARPTPSPAKSAEEAQVDAAAKKAPTANSTANNAKRDIEEHTATLDAITQVLPKIPQAALDTINGRMRINVRVRVDGAGNVRGAVLEPPPASKYFTDRVLEAAIDWRFPMGNISQDWLLHFELSRDQTRVYPAKVSSH